MLPKLIAKTNKLTVSAVFLQTLLQIIMILDISNINHKFGDQVLLENVSFCINNGEKIGLVGGNGCGKTTLLNLIVGNLDIQSGAISKASGLTLGYLAQTSTIDSDNTVYQELLSVFDYQSSLIEQQEALAVQLSGLDINSSQYAKLAEKFNRVLAEIDRTDAYNTSVKVDTVLNGMGIMQLANSVVATLSGGERTKVELSKLLLSRPQLLILDEPTNHLDLSTIEWLQQFLVNISSSLLVVSHDRLFLDKIANGIVEIFDKKAYQYKGNYSAYVVARDARLAQESKEYVRQQKEIAKLTDYIARNKARASTANMAKSREKALERMEIVEKPSEYTRNANFRFVCSDQPSEKVISVNNLSVQFDGRTVLDQVSLLVGRGEKIAIIGDNGSGKSTLLRYIVGMGLDKAGSVILGKNVRLGYYDQQAQNLDYTLNVLEQLWYDNTLMSQTEVRSLLAMVGLVGQEAFKSVASLSGGERARLALCMLMAKDNNCILLDEPTNHLDLASREKLEQALINYNGTLLFVSHDRYFVNKLATAIVNIADGKATTYVGNYDNYLAISQRTQPVNVAQPKTNYRDNKQRSVQTARKQRIAQIEKRLEDIYQQEATLSQEISSKQVAENYQLLADKCKLLESITKEAEQLLIELDQLGV